MIPTQFDYAVPDTLEAAITLLNDNPGARILAGGHSLLTEMKLRHTSPPLLVDLRKIRSLRGVHPRSGNGSLRLGAMTPYAEIVAVRDVREHYPALVEALNNIGDAQVRNRGTIGGNLAYNDPAADLPAVALALEATINTVGPKGARTIPAEVFIVGPFETDLEPGDIITWVDLPPSTAGTGSAYEKFKNPANSYAICGIAAKVMVAADGIRGCRVAVTGATEHATRLREVEAALEGKKPTAQDIAAAAERAGQGVSFVSDLYASAAYRAHLTRVLTERALTRAVARAGVR